MIVVSNFHFLQRLSLCEFIISWVMVRDFVSRGIDVFGSDNRLHFIKFVSKFPIARKLPENCFSHYDTWQIDFLYNSIPHSWCFPYHERTSAAKNYDHFVSHRSVEHISLLSKY